MLGIGRLGCDPRAAPQLPVGLQPRWVQPAWQAELTASAWVCSPQSASINIYALWQKRKKKICSFVTLQQCRERIWCCVVLCRVVLCCVVRESRVLRITRARRCGERWCDSEAAVQLRSARLVQQHLRKWLRIHQGNFCTFSHPVTFQGSSLEAFGRKDNTKLNKTWLLDFWLCARFVYAEILVRKTNRCRF